MSKFYVFSILSILLFVTGTWMLLKDLYTLYTHGRNIVKVNKGIGLAILWMVLLIVWCLLSWKDAKLYVRYENDNIIESVLTNIFWIEFSISNVIKSLKSSGIRENGIYISGDFYKWPKVKSYNWIAPNIIEFKVKAFFKINSSLELKINEEVKAEVKEVIQRNIML
ncbi:DUF5673 domain-containing protein [Clostridium beijerinckii]|uniref:DUF5673 domain-containing protein n=1 Tax=Clostridium beijerinckii TaxID=1520 RepID=A0AAX0B9V2_CLOBE|nr:DUF5673 domain-containing protein [Clostridium beijerinckii]MBA8933535.1 hypothetical protein [Clostridium beijerinckii]NOW05513.1 hypothetical protein [Clostridium beijerinckii]NRT36525.1 hypothetical protein [Clostridium beijerinckii]NRT44044.1 hypothetical protein [Clostridium beijerinckii]NRT91951.1 hypothetical protein [Clostridium beijerinckii]